MQDGEGNALESNECEGREWHRSDTLKPFDSNYRSLGADSIVIWAILLSSDHS